ncbi:uncharacterized protein HMPREF1541_00096 [Cyphellophora europaea CBS 101466]|uniref:AB hydrolase-1 domain-containing protein n=1 Tax=Cyphellophora europaea (strain CBS 101466) TaxID=1220924 RepID=W2SBE2_CYPE1|nr:uncharacterized protein HMPREF1541_00096 [Cyphellophora europaea CBS 101466]ETN45915.1 hypothetical protein HMPREF1541_00096 [Cyphellophora europaea CBS 101466]
MSSSAESGRDSQTITLSSYRTLGFAEYGSPTGYPLIYFHGFPSSRLEGEILHKAARKRNIRVVAPDRPGFGLSTYDPNYTITSWVEDVRELVKQLNLQRFAVLGLSGGGPYALACAKDLPASMMTSVGVAVGSPYWAEGGFGDMPWWSRISYWLVKYAPGPATLLVSGLVGVTRLVTGTSWGKRMIDKAVEAERKKQKEKGESNQLGGMDPLQGEPIEESRQGLLRALFEPFTQGSKPTIRELKLFTIDWGFELKEVGYDKVMMWGGTKDVNAPISGVRYIASAVQHSELREYEGSHGEIVTQVDDILDTLVPEEARHLL